MHQAPPRLRRGWYLTPCLFQILFGFQNLQPKMTALSQATANQNRPMSPVTVGVWREGALRTRVLPPTEGPDGHKATLSEQEMPHERLPGARGPRPALPPLCKQASTPPSLLGRHLQARVSHPLQLLRCPGSFRRELFTRWTEPSGRCWHQTNPAPQPQMRHEAAPWHRMSCGGRNWGIFHEMWERFEV